MAKKTRREVGRNTYQLAGQDQEEFRKMTKLFLMKNK